MNPTHAAAHAEFVRGLHALADFLNANPDLIPRNGLYLCRYVGYDPDPRMALDQAAARFAPDAARSDYPDGYTGVARRFGPHTLNVIARHDDLPLTAAGALGAVVGGSPAPTATPNTSSEGCWEPDCSGTFHTCPNCRGSGLAKDQRYW